MTDTASTSAIPSRLFWSLCLILATHLSYWGPNSDTMSRNIAALSISLSTDHAIQIDRFVLNMAGGPDGFVDKARVGDHFYSGLAPGVSILLAPIALVTSPIANMVFTRAARASLRSPAIMTRENVELLLLQFFGTLLIVIPLTAWAWTRLYKYLRNELHLEAKACLIAVGAGALCSSLAFYSTYISGKQVATMLGLLAFTFAQRPKSAPPAPRRMLWAGLLTGAAVACEYTMAVFAVVLFAYVLATRPRRDAVLLVLGGTVWIAAIAVYHVAAFGGPLRTGYQLRANDAFVLLPGHLASPPMFTQFSWRRLVEMTVGGYKGIFVYMPWFVLALAGLWQLFPRAEIRRDILFCFGIIGGFLLLLSFSPYWFSTGWGMRYLLPMFPYFAIGLAIWLGDVRRSAWVRTLTYALILVAFVVNYMPFGAGEASNWDPVGTFPVIHVAEKILSDGFVLYNVDFVARNLHRLSTVEHVGMHLLIYGVMFAGLALIWRRGTVPWFSMAAKLRPATARSAS